MSKTEEKKQATKAKHEFITNAAQIVMITAIEFMTGSAKTITLKLTAKNRNRYVSLHQYGCDLLVKIYKSGDIDVTLKEFCHADISFRLVEYVEAAPNLEAAFQRFGDDITLLLEDFIVHDCWHELMDYMDWHSQDDGSLDWRAAEQSYRKEFYEPEQQHSYK